MITVVNLDGPDEGFNDPTMAAPVGGNPGTTIGQQRLIAFQHAANIWASLITSPVEIRVEGEIRSPIMQRKQRCSRVRRPEHIA